MVKTKFFRNSSWWNTHRNWPKYTYTYIYWPFRCTSFTLRSSPPAYSGRLSSLEWSAMLVRLNTCFPVPLQPNSAVILSPRINDKYNTSVYVQMYDGITKHALYNLYRSGLAIGRKYNVLRGNSSSSLIPNR